MLLRCIPQRCFAVPDFSLTRCWICVTLVSLRAPRTRPSHVISSARSFCDAQAASLAKRRGTVKWGPTMKSPTSNCQVTKSRLKCFKGNMLRVPLMRFPFDGPVSGALSWPSLLQQQPSEAKPYYMFTIEQQQYLRYIQQVKLMLCLFEQVLLTYDYDYQTQPLDAPLYYSMLCYTTIQYDAIYYCITQYDIITYTNSDNDLIANYKITALYYD